MHKSATKCNETVGKWCKNKHGASKIIDTLEMYHLAAHPSLELVHTSFVWGPVDDPSQSLFLPATLHTHPFAAPTSVRYPRRTTSLVVVDLGILVLPDNELPPPVWLCPVVTPASALYPRHCRNPS
jgi:hypothetical protein